MPGQDDSETKPTVVMIGPVGLAGLVFAVRAIRRRSYASALLAVGLFGVEAGCRPYRKLFRDGALRLGDRVSGKGGYPDPAQTGA